MENKISRGFLYTAVSLYPFLFFAEKIFVSALTDGAKAVTSIFVLTVCFCACEDLITRTIPNFFNVVIFLSGLTFAFYEGSFHNMTTALLKSFVLSVLLVAVFFAAKGGIGGGDIKLAAAASAFIGPMNAVIVFCRAALLAAPLSLHLLLLSKFRRSRCRPCREPCPGRAPDKSKRTKQPLSLPFGPFYAICLLIELNSML